MPNSAQLWVSRLGGLGKPILDKISKEETDAGRPDVTFMVVSAKNGLPAQIDFRPANPPSSDQKEQAKTVIEEVFQYYGRPTT